MSMMIDQNVPTEFLRDYFKHNNGVCLACGGENLDSKHPKVNSDGDLIVNVGCAACKSIWVETYELTQIKMVVQR